MALLKEIVNENGVTTNYHKISRISLQNNVLSCFVESYVSENYRETENSADSKMFRLAITVEEEESMGIRQLGYTKLKELEDWAGATDC